MFQRGSDGLSVTVIIFGNEIGDPFKSRSTLCAFHFRANTFENGMNQSLLPLLVRQPVEEKENTEFKSAIPAL